MKIDSSIIRLFLVLTLGTFSTVALGDECAQVDCDCGVIREAKWRDICLANQAAVISECQTNQGKPKSYCGLHGPAAHPVAISLQSRRDGVSPSQDVKSAEQMVATQSWSVTESIVLLRRREKAKQYGDAIQLIGLIERETEKLYELQLQVFEAFKQSSRETLGREAIADYAEQTLQRGQTLAEYSETLWKSGVDAGDQRAQKAYAAIGFKTARLAAAVYEYAGDLYGNAAVYDKSARAWQSAADVAQTLSGWEFSTDKKQQHIDFYQAQAAGRLHRATYQWLEAGNEAEVELTSQRAQSAQNVEENSVATDQNTGELEAGDTRAIKRGSR